MAIVTPSSNRLDSFAAANGIAEQDVVRWNVAYFTENRTPFLPIGDDFRTSPPSVALGRSLVVNDSILTINNGDQLAVV